MPWGAALAALASACGGARADEAAPPRQAVLQLGRPICGDCCVEQVQRAFEGLAGVTEVNMSPGDLDFTVVLGAGAPAPEALVDRLVEAGVRGAKLGPAGAAPSPRKQWVVAR